MLHAQPCFLGADIGTGSCKTVLVDAHGRSLARAAAAYPSYYPQPGWVEQQPEGWLAAFYATARQVLAETGLQPAAVAIVGVTHNPVLLDRSGQLLRPAIHFWDKRSIGQSAQLRARWGSEIRQRALNEVDPLWTWPQLLWLREHEPALWSQIAALVFPKDYVRARLTGHLPGPILEPLITDPIDPTGTLLYDPRDQAWIHSFVADLGLPFSALPAVQPAFSLAGRVDQEAAAATGLSVGIPVATGTTDTAAELLGAGALQAGQGVVKLASVGRLMLIMDRPLADPHSLNYPHLFPGLWYPGSVTKHGAGAYQWARQALWPDLIAADPFAEMDRQAAEVPPGSGGLLFHPHLSGEYAPQWDPALRAAFTGLIVHHERAHLTRAVLEGVAFQVRAALDQLVAAGGRYSELRLIGGGAASPLWAQIMADVIGRELLVPVERSAAYGAALLAGLAVGHFPDQPASLASLIRLERRLAPIPRHQRLYQRLFALYQDLESALSEVSHALETLTSEEETLT